MTPPKTPAPAEPEKATPGSEDVPILDLDTLTRKRPTVLIDGKLYELRRLGEFGIEDQHIIAGEGKEFDELWHSSPQDLKREQKKRLPFILDHLTHKAVDAPEEVIVRLDDEQRKRIVTVFTSGSAQKWQEALERMIQRLIEARTAAK